MLTQQNLEDLSPSPGGKSVFPFVGEYHRFLYSGRCTDYSAHHEAGERAAGSNLNSKFVLIQNFFAAPKYDILVGSRNVDAGTKEKSIEPLQRKEK